MTTRHPNLSTELQTASEQLSARAFVMDKIGPKELLELAECFARWSKHAERLELAAGACAATMAAAELAAIEARSTDH